MLLTVPLEIDPSDGCEAVRYHFDVDVDVSARREELLYEIIAVHLDGMFITCDLGPRSEIKVVQANDLSRVDRYEWERWVTRLVAKEWMVRKRLESLIAAAVEKELEHRECLPSGVDDIGD